jgi:hypothetical protein
MYKIKRITSEYIDTEDRIRLIGLTEDGKTHALWFTLRLTNRLVVHCLNLLDQLSPEINKSAIDAQSRNDVQNLVQQSATRQIVEEPPVEMERDSFDFLVQEIDVSYTPEAVLMSFRAAEKKGYELQLDLHQLRQWLAMLYVIWQKAEWPTEIWPDWMVENKTELNVRESPIH